MLRIIEAASAHLARSVDEVNALNVYPVPDGDTGTNMLHTVRSALAHARTAEPTLGAVAAGAAHGALMGARGNSGVILSQILRGMKEAFAGHDVVDGPSLARAFALAKTHAYTAVTQPAAGTILTALAAMTDAVQGASDGDLALRKAVEVGVDAVERTKQDNPMNRAAGVVDAGARGLWLLLDGALAEVEGRAVGETELQGQDGADPAWSPGLRSARASGDAAATPTALGGKAVSESPFDQAGSAPSDRTAHARSVPSVTSSSSTAPDWTGAYDVQFLIIDPKRSADELRGEMLEFGADCVLVVGDETAVKVHVHTLQPDQIIRIGLGAGRIADVVVEDLDAMTAEHERATGIVVAPPRARASVGLVAVVPGDGFAEIVRSVGATPLRGGATMNPSTEELLDAIRAANSDHVVVLPNDRNVILAARQAAKLAEGTVTVIPTQNVAQGMSALAAFDPSREGPDVVAAIESASAGTHGIEITRAIRASAVDGQQVRKGEAIALLDGRLVARGDDELDVLATAAATIEAGLFTIFYGSGVDRERAERARERIRAVRPGAEVEVLHGGQPHYPFLVSAE